MIIANGTLFCDDGIFRKTNIETQGAVITGIGDNLTCQNHEVFDAEGCYVVPGLVDIHIHGAAGADFCDGTPKAVNEIARFLLSCGVTSFLGTSMTLPEEQLHDIYKTMHPLVGAEYPGQAVLRGIYMEGPFFSQERRGAQNAAYIIEPDFSMFSRLFEVSGRNIRVVAVAPEVAGGLEFVQLAASLCSVTLGHSTGDYSTASRAFSLGANLVTHLFNGMAPFNHREPGIVGAAFDSGAFVEIISDGIHLHPSVVRAAFKLFGDDRICLVSDAMSACGMASGQYVLGGQSVTVAGRSATIASGSLAGSVTTLSDCLRLAVEFGVALPGALKAATINPALAAGLDTEVGSLSIGKRADIIVLGRDLSLRKVVFGGKLIS